MAVGRWKLSIWASGIQNHCTFARVGQVELCKVRVAQNAPRAYPALGPPLPAPSHITPA